MERKTGLGPATPTLARLCSTNWAISACTTSRSEEEETRTPTTQLSLPPQSSASTNSATSPLPWNSIPNTEWHIVQNVRAENGTRTRDPNLGKVVLYQLSYFRLFPTLHRSVPLNASAKVLLFSELPNFSWTFFEKKMHFAHFSGKNAPFSVVIVPFYWFSSFFYPVFNPYAKDNPHIQIRVRFPNFHPNERYL